MVKVYCKYKNIDTISSVICYLDKDIDTICLSKKKIESLLVGFDEKYNYKLDEIKKLSKLNCDYFSIDLNGFTRKNIKTFFEITDFGKDMQDIEMYNVSDSLYEEILVYIEKKYKNLNSIYIIGNIDSIYFNEATLLKNISLAGGSKYLLSNTLCSTVIEEFNINYISFNNINNIGVLLRMDKLTDLNITVNTNEKIIIDFSFLDNLKHLEKINFFLGNGDWKINKKDYRTLKKYSNVHISRRYG